MVNYENYAVHWQAVVIINIFIAWFCFFSEKTFPLKKKAEEYLKLQELTFFKISVIV